MMEYKKNLLYLNSSMTMCFPDFKGFLGKRWKKTIIIKCMYLYFVPLVQLQNDRASCRVPGRSGLTKVVLKRA